MISSRHLEYLPQIKGPIIWDLNCPIKVWIVYIIFPNPDIVILSFSVTFRFSIIPSPDLNVRFLSRCNFDWGSKVWTLWFSYPIQLFSTSSILLFFQTALFTPHVGHYVSDGKLQKSSRVLDLGGSSCEHTPFGLRSRVRTFLCTLLLVLSPVLVSNPISRGSFLNSSRSLPWPLPSSTYGVSTRTPTTGVRHGRLRRLVILLTDDGLQVGVLVKSRILLTIQPEVGLPTILPFYIN